MLNLPDVKLSSSSWKLGNDFLTSNIGEECPLTNWSESVWQSASKSGSDSQKKHLNEEYQMNYCYKFLV